MNPNMCLTITTNIMTPYRKFLYDKMYYECQKNNIEFYVLIMAKSEYGRHWNYDDLKTNYTILLPNKTVKICGIEIHINWKLKKILKKIQPNIIICGGSYLYPIIPYIAKLKKKFNYIVFYWNESHLNEKRDYGKIKLIIREKLRKKIIGNFQNFWITGKFSKEFVENYSKKENHFIFVPNLVDNIQYLRIAEMTENKKIEIKKEYNIDLDQKIFLSPVRLTKVKGILEFLDLYKECNLKNIVYLIVGDGELSEDIRNFCLKYNLNVQLLGYKKEEEMIKLYSIANGVILPSLSDPNPLTCIESCWSKLPLLVSKHVGNHPELVHEGKNGFVFDYDNREEAINKINLFLNEKPSWYTKAGNESFNIVSRLYNPETVISRVIKETKDIYIRGNKND